MAKLLSRTIFMEMISARLDGLASLVKTNNSLGSNSGSRDIEDFFGIVLNHILLTDLQNLNEDEVANRKAIDLGDKSRKIAFQVTAKKDGRKINETLCKLTSDDIRDYPDFRILVVGRKQTKYSLDQAQCKRTGFTVSKIWDIRKVISGCRRLKAPQLEALLTDIDAEYKKIELVAGNMVNPSAALLSSIEPIPEIHLGELQAFVDFFERTYGRPRQTAVDAFKDMVEKLQELPRDTRECLGTIFERREKKRIDDGSAAEYTEIDHRKLARLLTRDIDADLAMLRASGFIERRDSWARPEDFRWRAHLADPLFNRAVLDYLNANKVDVRRAFTSIDFRSF